MADGGRDDPADGREDRPRVVVGLDPWVSARAALRLALGEAAARDGRLDVIAAYVAPSTWAASLSLDDDDETVRRRVEAEARAILDEVLAAEAVEHPAACRVPVALRARSGQAGPVLVEAARGADLLVLGHHGHGALSTALLGSVGLHCLVHAPCAVVIVPTAPAPRRVRREWSGRRP